MHYFEFAVTPFVDWKEISTVFVKAHCSSDAIRYLMTLTSASDCDLNNDKFPFADFKFRTAVPECCLPCDPVVYYAPSK